MAPCHPLQAGGGEKKKRKTEREKKPGSSRHSAAVRLQAIKFHGFKKQNKTDKVYQTFMIFHTGALRGRACDSDPGQEFKDLLELLDERLIWWRLKRGSFGPQTALILVELFV